LNGKSQDSPNPFVRADSKSVKSRLKMLQFDEAFYLAQNPDVAAAIEAGVVGSAEEHFNTFGFREGRNPNPLFDTSHYLSQNPDVADADVNPLEHFNAHGDSEGRSPNPLFDAAFYLQQNPDVAEAGINPFEHFLSFGASEGRDPSPFFDMSFYNEQNPDVTEAGVNPLTHFLSSGQEEGRAPNADGSTPPDPNASPAEPDGEPEPDVPAPVPGGGGGGGGGGGAPVNGAPSVAFTPALTQIDENADTSARTKVADILISDDGLGDLTVSLTGDDAGLFEIDGTELYLKAGVTLDFEQQQSLNVAVTVDDSTIGATPDDRADFSLTVSDVNEAPTAVTLTAVATSLDENTDTTSAIKIADIAVTDDALGTETLGLTGADADKFEIVGTELFLKAGTALDADTDTSFEVAVTADDTTIGAANSVEATSDTFTLTINNVDEAPQITSSATPAAVAENTATVLTPTATDPDGETAVFSVAGGANQDLFEIDGSGDLAFKAAPDYESLTDTNGDGTSDPLEVVIRATDPNDNTLFDEQTVSVTVSDVNEAPTAVTLTAVATSLDENTDTTSAIKIADIAVTDDALGTETLGLTGADADKFEIVGTELFLKAGTALDADTDTSFEVAVTADDTTIGAANSVEATSDTFTLTINNVDEAPQITSSATPAAVAENTATVLTPTATDPDGETAVFSVAGGANQDLFEIDGSGDLAFKAAPDYESLTDTNGDGTSDPLEVVIRATDPNDNTLFDEQTVSVTVSDVNEAPTAVTLTAVATSLDENTDTTSAIKIADIAVTDDALGTETLGLTGADADKFEIVGTELFLKAGTALDADTDTSFEVAVTADDTTIGAANSVEATSDTFTLTINNVDEAPQITSSATPAAVAENTATVLTPTATDPDGETAVFSVAGGANQDLFEIDGSGDLAFKAAPDYESLTDTNGDGTSDPLEVVIRATDPNDNTLFDEQTVSVTVSDVNEAPTAVTLTAVATSLDENTDTTSAIKIADIAVTDDALGTETLGLTGADADKFEIVGTELFLKAGTALDADTDTSFEVAVTADDTTIGAANSVEATSDTFTLTINNVDEAPQITSSATPAAVAENTATVLTPTATDPDGETAVFSVAGGANQDLFEIDGSGDLAFKAAPDYESLTDTNGDGTSDPLEVVIRATDPNDNTLFDEQTVSVTVSDVNEAPTAVTLTAVATSLDENTDTTSAIKIADIAVTDDALGTETLGLTGADADKFEIVGTELFLKAGTALDADTDTSFEVAVTADDTTIGAANSVEATSDTFTLTINNVDEAPQITSNEGGSSAIVTVAENQTAVTTIVAADAEDDADGLASTFVSFDISGGADQDLFGINTTTGALFFSNAPDFESPASADGDNSYEVEVRARDSVGLESRQIITVDVTGVPDVDLAAFSTNDVRVVAPGNVFFPIAAGGSTLPASSTTPLGSSAVQINAVQAGYYLIDLSLETFKLHSSSNSFQYSLFLNDNIIDQEYVRNAQGTLENVDMTEVVYLEAGQHIIQLQGSDTSANLDNVDIDIIGLPQVTEAFSTNDVRVVANGSGFLPIATGETVLPTSNITKLSNTAIQINAVQDGYYFIDLSLETFKLTNEIFRYSLLLDGQTIDQELVRNAPGTLTNVDMTEVVYLEAGQHIIQLQGSGTSANLDNVDIDIVGLPQVTDAFSTNDVRVVANGSGFLPIAAGETAVPTSNITKVSNTAIQINAVQDGYYFIDLSLETFKLTNEIFRYSLLLDGQTIDQELVRNAPGTLANVDMTEVVYLEAGQHIIQLQGSGSSANLDNVDIDIVGLGLFLDT
jgi:seryl-tRNA(Sec) selenium transferase